VRLTLITAVAAVALTATACTTASSNSTAAPAANTPATASSAPPKAAPPKDANTVLAALLKAVPTAKAGTVITEANDGNHLIGRPGQYTSKVTFTDSRIKAGDVLGNDPTDVGFGGSVEVFANAKDAKARADYIQAIVKSMPALLEYDYAHGNVVVRVSHLLPPSQAGEYDKAAASLG
jgi:hypothetical protein